MSERYRSIVDVHVVLRDHGSVLLARRAPGLYAGGLLHMPSGHLEDGEHVAEACVREAYEEVGVTIDPHDLRLLLTMHHRNADGAARIGLFFEPAAWSGTPYNREPSKCTELGWYEPTTLPVGMVTYARNALTAISRGESFALDGWPTNHVAPPAP